MSPHTPVVVAMRASAPPSPAEPVSQTNRVSYGDQGTRIDFAFLGGFNISHQAQGAALILTTSLAEVTQGKQTCISNPKDAQSKGLWTGVNRRSQGYSEHPFCSSIHHREQW